MLKIIIVISALMLAGCTTTTLEVQTGKYPVVKKAKWQGNVPATLEDILRELDERRAIEDNF